MRDVGIWLLLLPLSAGTLCLLAVRKSQLVGLSTAVLMPFLGLMLVLEIHSDGVWRYALGNIAPPLGIALRADGFSAVMLLLSALVGSAVSIYAVAYFYDSNQGQAWGPAFSFWPAWMFLWAAINASFLSSDIFNIYVALELLTLAAVVLIVLESSTAAWTAALRYLLAAFLGSLVYLLGVGFLYGSTGVLDIQLLGQREIALVSGQVAAGLMLSGLFLKAALFPAHFWLPAAHSIAPAPVSALLSALVVKVGFYWAVRLWFEVFAPVAEVSVEQLIGALGAFAIVFGSFAAIRQQRLKMMIAYSTVAQVGYLFMLVPLAGRWATSELARFEAWSGGIYHALSHGFAKASMFLGAGVLIRVWGHDRIKALAGSANHCPLVYFSFGLAGLSLVGLPPSGGFVGKWLLLSSALKSGQWWWAVVLLLGGLLTAGYVAMVLSEALSAPTSLAAPVQPPPRSMTLTVLTLASLSLVIGIRVTEPLRIMQIGTLFQAPAAESASP